MFDYKRPLTAMPIKPVDFDVTKVENVRSLNDEMFDLVFKITDDFDLRRFNEAYSNAGAFKYYTCSIEKLKEIEYAFQRELNISNDGKYYLRGIELKIV